VIKPVRQAQLRQAVAAVTDQRAAPGATSPGAADLATAAGTDRLRVLVAEDNAVNQKLARAMLTRLGHASALASDGRAAIAEWGTGYA
jgi:two-component system sensor histidine kinase/response regulator